MENTNTLETLAHVTDKTLGDWSVSLFDEMSDGLYEEVNLRVGEGYRLVDVLNQMDATSKNTMFEGPMARVVSNFEDELEELGQMDELTAEY